MPFAFIGFFFGGNFTSRSTPLTGKAGADGAVHDLRP